MALAAQRASQKNASSWLTVIVVLAVLGQLAIVAGDFLEVHSASGRPLSKSEWKRAQAHDWERGESIIQACYNTETPAMPFFPGANEEMQTCCWYGDNTCCIGDGIDTRLSELDQYFQRMVEKAGELNLDLDAHAEQCFNFIADFWCLACAPDTYSFTRSSHSGGMQISLCSSWCEAFHDACKNSPFFGNGGDDLDDMCDYMISQWQGDDSIDIVDSSDASGMTGGRGCYNGVGAEAILDAACTPFHDFGDAATETSHPVAQSSGTAGMPWLQISVLGGAAVVALGVIVCAVLGCLVVFVRRKRAPTSGDYRTVDAAGLPSLQLGDDDDGL